MYRDERDIYFYDASSRVWNRRYSKGLPPFPHFKLAWALREMFRADLAEDVRNSTKQAVYIQDMKLFSDRCEMLFGFSDPRAANPTLNDRPLRKRRTIAKQGDEGIEHSAHAIWHFGTKTNSGPCSFYLEGAVALRATSIMRFVNKLLRTHAANTERFHLPDPEGQVDSSGNYKKIKTRPFIQLTGHPSQEFIKDLRKGELGEVELYTETQRSKIWDSKGYAVEEHRSVLIKPNSKKLHLPSAKGVLDGLFSPSVRNDYEYARVKFKTETSVVRNVRIFSENYNLINDDSYVKKERVSGLGDNLPNAFDAIYKPIMRRMRNLAGL